MIARRQVTNALLDMLRTATGMPVGDGAIPDNVTKPPYYILYSLPYTTDGAPFSDLGEDAELIYQLTSVSGPDPNVANSRGTRNQTEWLADKARNAVLGRDPASGQWLYAITVPSGTVYRRWLDTEPGGTSDPQDAIISYVQRFGIALTST